MLTDVPTTSPALLLGCFACFVGVHMVITYRRLHRMSPMMGVVGKRRPGFLIKVSQPERS